MRTDNVCFHLPTLVYGAGSGISFSSVKAGGCLHGDREERESRFRKGNESARSYLVVHSVSHSVERALFGTEWNLALRRHILDNYSDWLPKTAGTHILVPMGATNRAVPHLVVPGYCSHSEMFFFFFALNRHLALQSRTPLTCSSHFLSKLTHLQCVSSTLENRSFTCHSL